MHFTHLIAITSVALAASTKQVKTSCPPAGFDSASNFQLDKYVGKWYVQEMSVTRYLPLRQFYCVTAEYTVKPNGKVRVENKSRYESVTGERKEIELEASLTDSPSKLKVGPTWLPGFLRGPYWVVATSTGTERYEWAIITGGSPKTLNKSNGLCSTQSKSFFNFNGNDQGFWIFARVPVLDEDTLKSIRATAESLGLDTSVLHKVKQEGCPAIPGKQEQQKH